ncbi:glycosyltransferase [Vibrio cholerae]|uniref:glycosyltransferase n=1 Tax=Vibrio cholerae TaxID=666 RepID=UPI0011D8954E|nr:glycosyltransferase [Vibrio cholerae]TXY77768.1 glycosyltransferase family 4 protein [Vibrio cholerae]BCI77250.1 D-inositol-3-phosphate glycosyltransferase [Vibrio cholerae]BCN16645.1 putative glycosyltransferase [Vibrio cholerae]
MKRILALNFFPAFVPVSNGGESKLYNFYKVLSKYHHITLLTSTHPDVNEETIYHTATFVERRIPKDNYFELCWGELSSYLYDGNGDLSAPAIAASSLYPTAFLASYLNYYESADIIIHDSPFTVDFDIFLGCDNKLRVYNSYNCETELYQTLHPSEKSRPIVELVAKAEEKLLNNSDLILYCGESDYESFKKIAPHKESVMFYSPNGMIEQHRVAPQRSKKNNHSAVFIGSAHLPNVQAASYIAKEIAPKCPNIIFDIIGDCLPEGKYEKNVIRHGRVSDVKKVQIFENASIALNPMESGSGSNIKALDYFSYALPILSTSFGMRGFNIEPGKHFIEGALADFPALLNHHLADENFENTIEIGFAGKHLASKNYTCDAIVANLLPELDSLIKEPNTYTLVLNDYNSFSGVGGGATRTRGLYQAVNDISSVVFVCFSDDEKLSSRKYNDRTHVISIPKSIDHRKEVDDLNSQFHISCDDIIASNHCAKNNLLIAVYNILKKAARFIVVEHPYMTPLPIAYHDRFIYSSQNDETKLKSSLLEWHPKKDYLIDIVTVVEKNAVEKSAATIAVSDDDAYSLLVGKKTAGPMVVVRNGSQLPVAISDSLNQQIAKKVQKKSAVFLGSAHMPNVDAINYLLKEVVPKCPDVQFNIIGSVCDAIGVKPAKNVILWGMVDEETKCAILQNSLFAVNPVISGSGSNIKLADFFANGLFVVSTKFGLRGYPENIQKHIALAEPEAFSSVINALSMYDDIFSDEMRQERKNIFLANLSMVGISKKFVDLLLNLEKPKRKVLFVTYRYTYPELGGAESNLKRFLKALGDTQDFEIDVVTTEVSRINNYARFMERYDFDAEMGAPIEMSNLRFARFPVDRVPTPAQHKAMNLAWRVQPAFEKAIVQQAGKSLQDGLAWGWADLEGEAPNYSRWSYSSCAVNVAKASKLKLAGYSPEKSLVTLQSSNGVVYLSQEIENNFVIELTVEGGFIEIFTSSKFIGRQDPRPLGFILNELRIDDVLVDLAITPLADTSRIPADKVFNVLSSAAEQTRFPLNMSLTDIRGPHSSSMESYISSNIDKYDLLVTHNIVFKPAIFALEVAKQNNVPSLLIPHAHLDDDYYHFPDLLNAARNATKVLAVPKAASAFYTEKGCHAEYLPGGADTEEEFLESDRAEFNQVYASDDDFVLVLGRKSGAKGYREVIQAVESINKSGNKLRLVMIGPNDDGVAINSPYISYLGRQPRSVVRGALMSCLALVNMSSSESFGIVLLEAWLAKKPVIANKYCVAFHDMAIDNENALMVATDDLRDALLKVLNEPLLRKKLGESGYKTAQSFSWYLAENKFVDFCRNVIK